MKRFLTVVGPVAGNFFLWALISFLPVHFMFTFALVLITGLLMVYALVRLNRQYGQREPIELKSAQKAISKSELVSERTVGAPR